MNESLFDFEFEPQVFSDTEVEEMWNLFRVEMKKNGNYYNEAKIAIEIGITKYLEEFVSRGYMKHRVGSSSGYMADRNLLLYHTVEEVLEEFEEQVEEFLKNPSSDYRGSASFLLNLPCDMAPTVAESQKLKKDIYEAIKPLSKRIAIELGLDYYLAHPKSTQMNAFSDKAYKKHFLPFFYDLVIPITDYDEMNHLLRNHSFVVGRGDWFSSYGPPVLLVEKPMLSDLEIAVLCQTTDKKVIKEILTHCGKSMGGGYNTLKPRLDGLLFPPSFTYQDYLDSITIEDAAKIIANVERLERLHGKKVS